MGKLNQIDQAADSKGSVIATLWQLVKFTAVSLIAFVVQFGLLNILLLLPQIKAALETPYAFWIFSADGADKNGLGYFIAFNIANITAQIVAFFVNRKKTFNSSVNIAATLPIYIVFTIALICFSAWLAPILQAFFVNLGLTEQLSANASAMVCSFIQFILYFPVDKILFHQKKKKA